MLSIPPIKHQNFHQKIIKAHTLTLWVALTCKDLRDWPIHSKEFSWTLHRTEPTSALWGNLAEGMKCRCCRRYGTRAWASRAHRRAWTRFCGRRAGSRCRTLTSLSMTAALMAKERGGRNVGGKDWRESRIGLGFVMMGVSIEIAGERVRRERGREQIFPPQKIMKAPSD